MIITGERVDANNLRMSGMTLLASCVNAPLEGEYEDPRAVDGTTVVTLVTYVQDIVA